MGIKRSADELETSSHRPRRQTTKRTKLSPTTEQRDVASTPPSSGSVSEDSALQSSPPVSDHTRKTSVSSIEIDRDNSSRGSGSSASGSESITDEDGRDEIVTIGGPKKPLMAQSNVTSGAQDLRSRLESLLPQIATSNELLLSSAEGVSMSIEDVKEGEQYIEMNLGLGVLEEKRGEDDSCTVSESSRDNDGEDELENDIPVSSNRVARAWNDGETNVMDTLFGRAKQQQWLRRPGLEDLG